MYSVYDNGKPARLENEPWRVYQFETFEEALEYAESWLGHYAGIDLTVNVPVDYSGYGDTIEIRFSEKDNK